MLTVAFIAFMLFQYVGDPVDEHARPGRDAGAARSSCAPTSASTSPFPVQFAHFVGNAVQGEFGLSLRQGAQGLVADRRATAGDARAGVDRGAVMALAFGIPMGVYSALRRGTFVSQAMMTSR